MCVRACLCVYVYVYFKSLGIYNFGRRIVGLGHTSSEHQIYIHLSFSGKYTVEWARAKTKPNLMLSMPIYVNSCHLRGEMALRATQESAHNGIWRTFLAVRGLRKRGQGSLWSSWPSLTWVQWAIVQERPLGVCFSVPPPSSGPLLRLMGLWRRHWYLSWVIGLTLRRKGWFRWKEKFKWRASSEASAVYIRGRFSALGLAHHIPHCMREAQFPPQSHFLGAPFPGSSTTCPLDN